MGKTLSVTEAAKMLGISRAAVHAAIQRGAMKARAKVVRKIVYRIPLEVVESYEVNRTNQECGKKNR